MKAALFDMDGTLVDTERIWPMAIRHALQDFGIDASCEEIARIEISRVWEESYLDIARRWPGNYTRQDLEERTVPFYEAYAAEHSLVIPGTVALFRRLHQQGILTGIVSGAHRGRIKETVASAGLTDCLDFLVSCEMYRRGKPEPDPYLAAAELLKLPPGECVVFEDAALGVQSAVAAGMPCVAYDPEPSMGQDFSGASCVLKDLSQFSEEMLYV